MAADSYVNQLTNKMNDDGWPREMWDSSTSAKAYNADWWDSLTPEKEPDLWAEIRSIFDEEKALSDIPVGRQILSSG